MRIVTAIFGLLLLASGLFDLMTPSRGGFCHRLANLSN